ncbi:MAG: hypothetical protein JRN23_00760 [Nitrososphaerota archaeon]|nr:hypothetical protein [Nitrososphaerota archaeon]
MARRRRRETAGGTATKRAIRVLIVVAFLAWLVLAFEQPLAWYGSVAGTQTYSTVGTYTLDVPGLTPVRYSAAINYSVLGAFSVGTGNPISMKATVYDVNVTDFGSVFQAIDLLYQKVDFNSAGAAELPYFHQSGPGTWTAQGSVAFAAPINFTGPELVPTTLPKNASITTIDAQIISQVGAYNYSFPHLKSQSYTDTLVAVEWVLRLGAMALGGVVLLLIPVLDRILVEDKSHSHSAPEGTPEGFNGGQARSLPQPCT